MLTDQQSRWKVLAKRLVSGLGVRTGELIQIRDEAGEYELLQHIVLLVELAGATPLVEIRPISHMHALWRRAPRAYLENWDKHRTPWMAQTDRILVLLGGEPDYAQIPLERFQLWRSAEYRLTALEESQPRPFLIAAIPTAAQAAQLGVTADTLSAHLMPALNLGILDLQRELQTTLAKLKRSKTLTIHTGRASILTLEQGDRRWLSDDGFIDADDIASGAVVSNLPAGALYTTVLEDKTRGSLFLDQALGALDVTLTFEEGRVSAVQALMNGDAIRSIFDQHTGEPRRIGHIGIGLNPRLRKPIGWTIVDEHVHGHLFISFGENRYMGGDNESSLNLDFALRGAKLFADDKQIIPIL